MSRHAKNEQIPDEIVHKNKCLKNDKKNARPPTQ